MKESTHISHIIEGNANKDKYDAAIKKILGNKTILAWIMKYTMQEFASYNIEDIRECIEGTPEIAMTKVRPGYTPEAIMGMTNEDKVPGEGEITYDIRFFAITKDAAHIKIIINVEAQKSYYPGYDLVTRAIFYCSRMLSAQLDTEFVPKNYNDIKKVYSIWICMDVPKYASYTITRYKMAKEELYGHNPKENRYDLLEAVMICLGEEENSARGNKLHGMLTTLLSSRLSPQEKEKILEDEYNIETTAEMEGGLQQMCNLSEMIEEKGIEKGRALLYSLIKKGDVDIALAAKEAGISVEQFAQEMEKAGY